MTTRPGGGLPAIDVRTADARLHGGEDPAPLLLDVREPSEHADVRAEGAVLAPMSGLASMVDSLPKDRPIFVICASGGRSAQVTGYLLASGWTDVSNVIGGTMAWAAAGLPVRHGPPDPSESELPG
ncbi:MAG TPA: rhodanese-like domain-containing protein [Candidatus Acidoferrum sp.]|jgi:rhodanese-related sulfurtransferase|nr:rhodanese-like domain-containing protein [Candidatus Acidoferrum sp.]